jgi:hypothetical protein
MNKIAVTSLNVRKKLVTLSMLVMAGALQLHAGLLATATFTDTQPTPGQFDYDLTLNNTGTTTIGTFWFSWIPGAGFMSATPTSVQSPTGWTDNLTNSGAAIQWVTTTNLLAPGASESGFMFDSTLSPAQLEAPFAGTGLGSGDPVATFFVYIAAPLADPGAQSVAMPAAVSTAAPEPSTMLLAALAIGLVNWRKLARSAAR